MTELELRPTSDYQSMRSLALASGLEDGEYSGFISAYGIYDGPRLVGCVGLKDSGGVFTVECLAISEELRGKGLGRRLLEAIEEDVRRRGASELWALARAPGFFEKLGFVRTAPPESGRPNLKGCLACPQYMRTCRPAIVVKRL